MEDRFKEFSQKIERKIVEVKSEVKHLAENVSSLGKTIDELGDEFGDFASYVSEMYHEHESRISALEKAIKK